MMICLSTNPTMDAKIKNHQGHLKRTRARSHQVTVTQYHPVEGQCSDNPLITADGSKIDLRKLKDGRLKWIAVSRDFINQGHLKYGDKVKISGPREISGIYTIHDTMNKRFRKRVDILTSPNKPAGLWHGVEIKKIEGGV